MNPGWSESEIETLIRLRNEGMSKREIGERLGRTRQAVIGIIGRLGLPPLDISNRRALRGRPAKVPQAKAAKVLRVRLPAPQHKLAPGLASDGGPGVFHDDLPASHCQFPIGDGRPWVFCGCQQERGPYCAAHAAIAYPKYRAEIEMQEAA